jgi:glycosyltransferase involved in cell wall biosynthesis
MKWSILILTQPSRKEFLARLLALLQPQVDLAGGVEIVVQMHDPQLALGENRQKMLEAAQGEYVCFVDDDDLVANDYVAKILPLLDGVDYIGFRLNLYNDGRPGLPTFHSLRFPKWYADDKGLYRDISHVNPIRRELALTTPMSGHRGEDARWSDAIRAKQIVRTEHFVDEVMYHYYYRSMKMDGGPMQGHRIIWPSSK